MLDNYDSVEPIILSVDENDEVTISHVAETIAAAMDFNVSILLFYCYYLLEIYGWVLSRVK